MNEQGRNNEKLMVPDRTPAERYAYYRRCQVFRKGGEQCKAPAETGSLICHAHAGQLAMAVRRERERRAVLEEAVAEMRRRGNPEFEAKDLFMDFKGIQVALAKMAQALINGRIDCKTAGQLVVQLQTASKVLWLYHYHLRYTYWDAVKLQTASKVLWLYHRGHRGSQRTATALTTKYTKEHKGLPQISSDGRRLKASTAKDTKKQEGVPEAKSAKIWAAAQHTETPITLMPKVAAFADIRGRPHGPPGWARAA